MRPLLLLLFGAMLGGILMDPAQAAKTASTARKPAAAKTVVATKAPAAGKKAAVTPARKASKRVRRASRSRRRGAPRQRVVHTPRQGQPTKERYSEIQQALIDKGYFTGSATGEWGADSMEALKRFQDDQSLKASGKINSLSLIALGLGAKHNPLGALPVIGTPVVAGPQAPEATDDNDEAADDPELVTPDLPGLQQ
jgi:peptidoglycan hydrolase-like protein with peptidoglycan-binding domain